MSEFFKPYEGTRPFFFVSYAHRQSDAVVDTIRILHEKGYRLWYDEGIPAGSDWPANIAQHMQSCERVVYFLSARAMESPNCFSEMRTAARLGKPVQVVVLEDVPREAAWKELLDGKPEIPLLATPEERADAILRSGFLPRRLRRVWWEGFSWRAVGLAVSLLLFLGAAGAFGALMTGRWVPVPQEPEAVVETPVPTVAPTQVPVVDIGDAGKYFAVSFPDAQTERAVRKALGVSSGEEIYRWQLAEIQALCFCGNMVTDSLKNVAFDGEGVCRVNGAPVVAGKVSDIRILENAARPETLALIGQPLGDLSPLNGLTLLRELSLAGSPVSDVSALRELPGLEILHLEHTAVTDLTPLEALPRLKTVTVSRDMLPLRWSDGAPFAVILARDGS